MQKRVLKFTSTAATIAIVFGAFFFCREIYSFLIYSLGVHQHLPRFLRIPSNNLNMCMIFLSYWLMLFFYFFKNRNTRALSVLSFIFGGLWLLWFVLCFVYRRESFGFGSLFFHLPDRSSRMLFYIDSGFFFWILMKSVWPTGERRSHLIHMSLAAAIMLCVFLNTFTLIAVTWPFTTDDAYITLRYSRHLAEGHGIVWNLGEPPVEGYSNFTFVLLGAACLKVGLDPVLVFKVINCFMLFGTCVVLYFLARRWVNPVAATLPAIFLTGYRGTIWWTVSGLETATYQFLVVVSVLLFFRGLRFDAVNPEMADASNQPADSEGSYRLWPLFWAGVIVLLASLTRPEGPLVMIALAAALSLRIISRFWTLRKTPDTRMNEVMGGLRAVIALVIGFAIGYGVFVGWRYHYFGRLVPNPVLVKSGYERNPMVYLSKFWAIARLFILFSLFQNFRRFNVRYVVVWGIPVLYSLILYNVDPFMGYENRLFLTAFAILLVPAAAGIVNAVDIVILCARRVARFFSEVLPTIRVWRQETIILLWLIAVIGTVRIGAFARFRSGSYRFRARHYAARMETRREMGEWVESQLGPDDWYSIGDAGIAPYVTHAKVIDSLALNSREYALPPINRSIEAFADFIISRRPSMIIIPSGSPTTMSPNGPSSAEGGIRYTYAAMLAHPDFQKEYEHVKTFAPPPPDDYNYFVYRLKD